MVNIRTANDTSSQERVIGFPLTDLLCMGCTLPEKQKHTDEKPCKECLKKAYSNAIGFIENTVLLQLSNMKSKERGIDGFVMPPSWSADSQPSWKGKGPWNTHRSKEARYVFQHGDLAAQNILIDSQTLQVKALIDWEYAGFFPSGMERWTGLLDKDAYICRRNNVADAIANFLAEEYLECCHKQQWNDRAELASLIEAGKLPDPQKMEQFK